MLGLLALLFPVALGWAFGDRWAGWYYWSVGYAGLGVLFFPMMLLAGAKTFAVVYVAVFFAGFLLVEAGVRLRKPFDRRRAARG